MKGLVPGGIRQTISGQKMTNTQNKNAGYYNDHKLVCYKDMPKLLQCHGHSTSSAPPSCAYTSTSNLFEAVGDTLRSLSAVTTLAENRTQPLFVPNSGLTTCVVTTNRISEDYITNRMQPLFILCSCPTTCAVTANRVSEDDITCMWTHSFDDPAAHNIVSEQPVLSAISPTAAQQQTPEQHPVV